ncbi:putative mRNA export factor GLE2 [Blattamonas nauphoetae]|uniref:mRNA export factor GLE2 n=1 Tax=Blattamonas nauphoetae TaxID=2049346 RepID=A0ABQ9Y4W0_9EUKA|nr:putative mRNA export factor GLE2 [Blattamonas nauphoetae]
MTFSQNQKPLPVLHSVPGVQGDTISCLSWSPCSHFFAASSWDASTNIWDISKGPAPPVAQVKHERPIFSCCFPTSTTLVTVGGDVYVKLTDLNTKQETKIGEHQLPIRVVKFNSTVNSIATASWDRKVSFWNGTAGAQPVMQIPLNERIYAMDTFDNCCVVSTAEHMLYVIDLRNPTKPMNQFQVETQATCAAIMPNMYASSIGTRNGKVQTHSFNEQQFKSFPFTAQSNQTTRIISAVNAISYSSTSFLCTGGGDCTYSIWDMANRKLCRKSQLFQHPITALSFSPDNKFLAFAAGPDWETGPATAQQRSIPVQIGLHELSDVDFQPGPL